eukprot:1003901-Alexandrium_andersonii.AAC.1
MRLATNGEPRLATKGPATRLARTCCSAVICQWCKTLSLKLGGYTKAAPLTQPSRGAVQVANLGLRGTTP